MGSAFQCEMCGALQEGEPRAQRLKNELARQKYSVKVINLKAQDWHRSAELCARCFQKVLKVAVKETEGRGNLSW